MLIMLNEIASLIGPKPVYLVLYIKQLLYVRPQPQYKGTYQYSQVDRLNG